MSRITRSIAEEVAKKLLIKKREKNQKRYDEISEILTSVQESKVPMGIMKMFNDIKTKHFFKTHSTVNINGEGLNHDYIHLCREVPSVTSYGPSIILEKELALNISKRLQDWKSHRNKLNDLETQTVETLVALRTYKKVQDLFPDAAQYLPKVETTCANLQCISLIVNEINSDE